MSRPWRLVVVFLAVAGCKGPGSASTATDPFFGRTRVEPPRTGAVRGQLPSTSNLAQGLNTGVGAPGMVQGQTAAGTGAGSSLPSNGSGASSSQPTQGSGSNSTGWFPAQPRTTSPVPAAIPPQTSGQYVPPDGSFGFPGPSPTSNLATSSPPGESISIPLAARTMGSPASDWSTRPVATPPSGTTSPSTASAGSPAPVPAGVASGSTYPSSPGASPGGTGNIDSYLGPPPTTALAGRERIVREIQPTPSSSKNTPIYSTGSSAPNAGYSSGAQPAPAAGKTVNLADLPDAGP